MTDITELAQRARINAECGEHLSPAETLELVEALESEKRICATWRKTAKSTGEKLEKAQTINAAAEKLVRCKGRYHSEQNYRALAALFGVKTPDLPPLDSESRTVKLPKLKMLEDYLAEVAIEERKQILVGVKLEFHRACVAAGIKVEAE
ncbi:Ead domain protein [Klebsiella pneumoniae]